MRECNPRTSVEDDNDAAHRNALGCLITAARITGVLYVLRGIVVVSTFTTSASSVAWYGVHPNQWDQHHLAYLAYLRLIMVLSEIHFGVFILITTFFADLNGMRKCLVWSSWMMFFHGLTLMLKKFFFFDNGGFGFDSWVIIADVLILDVIPVFINNCALLLTNMIGGVIPTWEMAYGAYHRLLLHPHPKKFIFTIGLLVFPVALCNAGLWQEDSVAASFATPEFMADPGFANVYKGWIGLFAIEALVRPYIIIIMFWVNSGTAYDYHCSRCVWTWSCANLVGWFAFKMFLDANHLPVGYTHMAIIIAGIWTLMLGKVCLDVEYTPDWDMQFRHTWMITE